MCLWLNLVFLFFTFNILSFSQFLTHVGILASIPSFFPVLELVSGFQLVFL